MSERVEALATRFAAANQALIDAIVAAPAAVLGRVTDAEGWSVVAVGAHVATRYDFLLDRARRIIASEEFPPLDGAAFHEENRQAAAENAHLPREEALALLRDRGATVETFLRGLDDDDLGRTKSIPAVGEQPVTAQTYIERVLIGHTEAHLATLRTALA